MAWTRASRAVALGLTLVGLLALGWWAALWRPARAREREARAAITQGERHLREGRPDRALRAVAKVGEEETWAAGALTVKGMALAALDRPDEARPLLERSLKLDPAQPMAAKVLAAVYFYQNENPRGFVMLDVAARLDPGDFRPWYGTGDIYRRLDRPAKAAEAFEQALRRRPDHHESRVGLIWARLATAGPESATPLLTEALRERPDDPEVLGLAARHALDLGRTKEAMDYADRCLALDPGHVGALLIRARLNQAAGHPDRALADAESAVSRAPDNLGALNQLGLAETALGLKERAAATFARHRKLREDLDRVQREQELVEAHPDDPEPRWRLGRVAAEAGLPNLAARSFRAALALDPSCEPARLGLAALGNARNGRNGASPTRPGVTGR
jgi:tetratricopeptide (TPR) repeat protein